MKQLNIEEIQKILPQRYPFLLIDKIIEIEPGQRVVAIKNVSNTEGFFSGHFPGKPVMPGALIIEAMAQASIVLYWSKYKDELVKTPNYYLVSVKVDLENPVYPGDSLMIESKALKIIPKAGFVEVNASIDKTIIAKGQATFAIER
ncbi:MAG: 3-hydroxyacyl-ACP dehydratase FabZ [Candidatus Omnitrophica bacterium]|nr:3-hydroxyacyl-ACP dehydratase FabZ [Candidatus Omnitrophota bacterium]MDD5430586.1 3-hydroxyacyl-ACP dehydratase FabZ [Candidatus Omnitrophota bacterium]